MIIILKIILGLLILVGFYVAKVLYKDFKFVEKSDDYEESTVADRIKIKFILYFSLISIFAFCLLLLYFVIMPLYIGTYT